MTLASICTGDTVEVYVKDADRWGDNESLALQDTHDCLVQDLSARESLQFSARGQDRYVQILFGFDPQISEKHVLKHTARADGSVIDPVVLEFKASEKEGPPGATWLWIVYARVLTQAGDPT